MIAECGKKIWMECVVALVLVVLLCIVCVGCTDNTQTQTDEDNSTLVREEQSVIPEKVIVSNETEVTDETIPIETSTEKSDFQYENKLEYVLTPYYYYMWVDKIERKGESYAIIGERVISQDIILTWKQKALLDAGLKLSIKHDGEEIDCIYSEIGEEYTEEGNWETAVVYRRRKEQGDLILIRATTSSYGNPVYIGEAVVDLNKPPYYGVAYTFHKDGTMMSEDFHLEAEYTYIIPGDAMIETILADGTVDSRIENITFDEFYERVVCGDESFTGKIGVHLENGEITRLYECYVP